MTIDERYGETITLPRAVRFPVELIPPARFDAASLGSWPKVPGRLEFVDGRLLYMPPCGDRQQDTVTDVVITLGAWVRANPEFVLATNEAGMRLGGATRAADVAIWRRVDLGSYTGGLRRVPPVLAVDVIGEDEPEALLRAKAAWYLEVGVAVVWIVDPDHREVLVLTPAGTTRHARGERLPAHPDLPGLSPRVEELFVQVG